MPEEPVQAPQRASPSTGRRLALLAACIVLGSLIGVAGEALGAGSAGFIAIPALIALAWFFVGDPTACLPK